LPRWVVPKTASSRELQLLSSAREVIDQYEQRAVLFQSEWEAHALSEAKSRLGISYDAFPHDAVLQN
jgi:hypothetical protein